MRRWLTIAALLIAPILALSQTTATLRTVLSGDSATLFRLSVSDGITPPGETFTRSSTATYRDAAGIIQTASTGVKRNAHYIGGKPTLLLEGQRTNLLLRSQELDNASWNVSAITVTANQIVSPDGTTTAEKALETVANAEHEIKQISTKSASALPYAASIFVKGGLGRTWCAVQLRDNGTGAGKTYWFNLDTGAIGASTGAGFTAVSVSIEAFPNGWYRCAVMGTSDTGTAIMLGVYPASVDGVKAYAGDITKGIYAWGPQLEQAAFPSSYIATTTATVTRAADSLSFPIGFNPQELTMFARFIDIGNFTQIDKLVVSISQSPAYIMIYGYGPALTSYHSAEGTGPVAVADGEAIEARAFLSGNGNIQLGVSRNGGSETLSTASNGPAIEPVWTNNIVKTSDNIFRDIIIARGNRSMDWFRARIAP